ncbi:TetR/AcrR family transcriptional regulator [Thalassiella azotivora]
MAASESLTVRRGTPRGSVAARRRAREREILDATRALFDERGVRDAQIEDIARAVGVNRTIVYRHFASKDEIFGRVLVEYLAELDDELAAAVGAASQDGALAPLTALAEAFVDYCLRHPAFTDCALAMLRRPGPELLDELSEPTVQGLGRHLATAIGRIAGAVRTAARAGEADAPDADLIANVLYAQVLGAVHLARAQWVVSSRPAPADVFVPVDVEQVRAAAVRGVLATARGR